MLELGNTNFPELFHLLSTIKESGTLSWQTDKAGKQAKLLVFERGRPVFAESAEQREWLGEQLCRYGYLSREELQAATAEKRKTGKLLGEILLEKGYIGTKDLKQGLALHLEEILYSFFEWDEGSFTFAKEGAKPKASIELAKAPLQLIREGIIRKFSYGRLKHLLLDANPLILPCSDPFCNLQELELYPQEHALYGLVNGRRRVYEIVQDSGQGTFDVLRCIYMLLLMKLCIAAPDDKALPRPPGGV